MDDSDTIKKSGWVEGVVDERGEHFKLTYKDGPGPAALLGKGEGEKYFVQFLIAQGPDSEKILEDVRSDLDYYLVKLKERNPWAYAQYHCSSGANAYSAVHWAYCVKDGKYCCSQVYCINGDAVCG